MLANFSKTKVNLHEFTLKQKFPKDPQLFVKEITKFFERKHKLVWLGVHYDFSWKKWPTFTRFQRIFFSNHLISMISSSR
jgi:hypothetical protein